MDAGRQINWEPVDLKESPEQKMNKLDGMKKNTGKIYQNVLRKKKSHLFGECFNVEVLYSELNRRGDQRKNKEVRRRTTVIDK